MPSMWAMTGERTGTFDAGHSFQGEHLREVLRVASGKIMKWGLLSSHHLLIGLFNKYLLVTCSRPGPVLSAVNTMINKDKHF